MNNTPHTNPAHPEASLRDAGLADIIKDLGRLGPAPNASREAFVTVVFLVLVAAIIAIVEPAPAVTGMLVVAAVVYAAARWLLGVRKWEQR